MANRAPLCRRVHRRYGSLHSGLTFVWFSSWGPGALSFLATEFSLTYLAAMNWAHVGLESCRMPSAPVVRYSNVVYPVFGVAAIPAVPQPHAWVLTGALLTQALSGFFTLRGPARHPPSTHP
jgi:hypothetical protein